MNKGDYSSISNLKLLPSVSSPSEKSINSTNHNDSYSYISENKKPEIDNHEKNIDSILEEISEFEESATEKCKITLI